MVWYSTAIDTHSSVRAGLLTDSVADSPPIPLGSQIQCQPVLAGNPQRATAGHCPRQEAGMHLDPLLSGVCDARDLAVSGSQCRAAGNLHSRRGTSVACGLQDTDAVKAGRTMNIARIQINLLQDENPTLPPGPQPPNQAPRENQLKKRHIYQDTGSAVQQQ